MILALAAMASSDFFAFFRAGAMVLLCMACAADGKAQGCQGWRSGGIGPACPVAHAEISSANPMTGGDVKAVCRDVHDGS